ADGQLRSRTPQHRGGAYCLPGGQQVACRAPERRLHQSPTPNHAPALRRISSVSTWQVRRDFLRSRTSSRRSSVPGSTTAVSICLAWCPMEECTATSTTFLRSWRRPRPLACQGATCTSSVMVAIRLRAAPVCSALDCCLVVVPQDAALVGYL